MGLKLWLVFELYAVLDGVGVGVDISGKNNGGFLDDFFNDANGLDILFFITLLSLIKLFVVSFKLFWKFSLFFLIKLWMKINKLAKSIGGNAYIYNSIGVAMDFFMFYTLDS